MSRIYLSPPDVGSIERDLLLDAFDSNWVAPLGPHVDAFESEFAAAVGRSHAAALSSGTGALHLALLQLGIGPGDEVVLPTLTFVATANAVSYVGATPVLVDSDAATWNLDPDLLAEDLRNRARDGRLPAAVITVDLYGQCADYTAIEPLCAELGVPLVEDAAEALGATWQGRPAGAFGQCAAFSFNGNKIITTSGGGMLVSDDAEMIGRTRFLATQARDPADHYEHSTTGYNYRLSNLLAALGRGQIRGLTEKIERRRAHKAAYRKALGHLAGVGFMPDDPRGEPTNWLTVATLDPDAGAVSQHEVRAALAAADIEARPAWKPMHRQPLFAGASIIGGGVADEIFANGICLPSGSSLTDADRERVIEVILGLAWPSG